jgi:hypothetical protein
VQGRADVTPERTTTEGGTCISAEFRGIFFLLGSFGLVWWVIASLRITNRNLLVREIKDSFIFKTL